ncbi:hypothetical protein B296_00036588 [Ensete ventricosum]|uniref:Uncharacterized protein n=1 Tax=Ensete ventricosum TaxID=4639 RepID=A0A426XST2_ENSVE|nr:hypothetical protein B296_00036588 [Ensete ventricosum]
MLSLRLAVGEVQDVVAEACRDTRPGRGSWHHLTPRGPTPLSSLLFAMVIGMVSDLRALLFDVNHVGIRWSLIGSSTHAYSSSSALSFCSSPLLFPVTQVNLCFFSIYWLSKGTREDKVRGGGGEDT